jgi:hypothetical protein
MGRTVEACAISISDGTGFRRSKESLKITGPSPDCVFDLLAGLGLVVADGGPMIRAIDVKELDWAIRRKMLDESTVRCVLAKS